MPILKKMRRMSDLLFRSVKEVISEKQKTIEEKAIEFLKDKKEISRIDFWNYIGDTYLADSILYSLYDQKKIEMICDHDGTKIIWKE
jgi:hypothetical protein